MMLQKFLLPILLLLLAVVITLLLYERFGESDGFVIDTTGPSNGNGGHTYGTTLSDDDRAALLEYLKTL